MCPTGRIESFRHSQNWTFPLRLHSGVLFSCPTPHLAFCGTLPVSGFSLWSHCCCQTAQQRRCAEYVQQFDECRCKMETVGPYVPRSGTCASGDEHREAEKPQGVCSITPGGSRLWFNSVYDVTATTRLCKQSTPVERFAMICEARDALSHVVHGHTYERTSCVLKYGTTGTP